jgi:hypothetical protein
MTHNIIVTAEHLQTIRKALVKQLQRAKEKNDTAEAQRARDVLGLIDLKLGVEK